MSNTIAIDLVLLPPTEIWQWAVNLSNSLNKHHPSPLLLDKTHLPHITLVQSFISIDQLDRLYIDIESLVKKTYPLELEVIGIEVEDNTAGFTISPTTSINDLYNNSMKICESFEVKPDKEAFLLDEGEVTLPGTMSWVTNFRTLDSYKPHISLSKTIEQLPEIGSKKFLADRLAICHLGNYCTCRKILKEWKLNN